MVRDLSREDSDKRLKGKVMVHTHASYPHVELGLPSDSQILTIDKPSDNRDATEGDLDHKIGELEPKPDVEGSSEDSSTYIKVYFYHFRYCAPLFVLLMSTWHSLQANLAAVLKQGFDFPGTFAYSKIYDIGDAPNPCAKIDGLGVVGLPLSERDVKAIIARSSRVGTSSMLWEMSPENVCHSVPRLFIIDLW
jgi:hypothetical protein